MTLHTTHYHRLSFTVPFDFFFLKSRSLFNTGIHTRSTLSRAFNPNTRNHTASQSGCRLLKRVGKEKITQWDLARWSKFIPARVCGVNYPLLSLSFSLHRERPPLCSPEQGETRAGTSPVSCGKYNKLTVLGSQAASCVITLFWSVSWENMRLRRRLKRDRDEGLGAGIRPLDCWERLISLLANG